MWTQTLVLLLFCGYYLCGLAFRIPSGPNVCVKKNDYGITENYCCFNSYYDKGQCKVCSPGTFSTDGKECYHCPQNMYGEQCKHTCNCNSKQACNTVHGCVNLVMEASTEGFDLYSKTKTDSDDIQSKFKSTSTFQETTGVEATTRVEYVPGSTDRDTSLVYILVISGGVVGWMVFCVAGTKFLYKWFQRKHRRTQPQNNIQLPQIIIHGPVQSTSDPLKENIYDEIEEVPTPELTVKRAASYVSVIGSTKSQESDDKVQCEITAAESKLTNEDKLSVSLSSVGSSSSMLNDGNEYLNPYTSLESNRNHKTYEACTN